MSFNPLLSFVSLSILVLLSTLYSAQAIAFYQWQKDNANIEARGLVRGFANIAQFPNDDTRYPDQHSSGVAGIARLMVDGNLDSRWHLEFNAYQTYIPNALVTEQSSAGLPASTERSAAFETSFSNKDHIQFVVDRFALRWSKQTVDITLGRQAINLATTFYFSPNDFFAPFSAQTFYRVYKPGVDALRIDIGLGELSQLTLISVLGYEANNTGWRNRPSSLRDTHLVRWSTVFGQFETTLIAGQVVDKTIIGIAAQGELFEWLGLRLEGHYADNETDDQQLSLGLEHRWENSLNLQWELFYNGLGSHKVSDYAQTTYLARRYSAIGGSYELSALLTGQVVVISNIDDRSQLLSLNGLYSLSDESELVFNLALPLGDKPEQGQLKSEFGAYPISTSIEVRMYF